MKRFVILVGHGGVPSDCPPQLVSEFKRLEAKGPSPELTEADRKLRQWPRTPKTDPYKAGLEQIGKTLSSAMPDRKVVLAYNEFCTPSLEDAFEACIREGAEEVAVISTMFTRGGVHSETEIPEILERLAKACPNVRLRYVWPFSLDAVAGFLASEIKRAEKAVPAP